MMVTSSELIMGHMLVRLVFLNSDRSHAVIHSMSKIFTTINFHNVFFLIWNYCVGIVVHSGSLEPSSRLKNKLAKYQPISV